MADRSVVWRPNDINLTPFIRLVREFRSSRPDAQNSKCRKFCISHSPSSVTIRKRKFVGRARDLRDDLMLPRTIEPFSIFPRSDRASDLDQRSATFQLLRAGLTRSDPIWPDPTQDGSECNRLQRWSARWRENEDFKIIIKIWNISLLLACRMKLLRGPWIADPCPWSRTFIALSWVPEGFRDQFQLVFVWFWENGSTKVSL